MTLIDLRSDIVTLPTEAMHHSPLGDDVFGEDPTVNRLETMTAERVGKEAALLVVSGTMGNARFRMLTHHGINPGEIDEALDALRDVMQGCY